MQQHALCDLGYKGQGLKACRWFRRTIIKSKRSTIVSHWSSSWSKGGTSWHFGYRDNRWDGVVYKFRNRKVSIGLDAEHRRIIGCCPLLEIIEFSPLVY